MIQPKEKIKVFISSKCGVKKYDKIRLELKTKIEQTNFATVYLFEETEASSLTAGQHYLWALEQSDVCIFLIDNFDNVTPGVQKEIDCAIKHKIKSLYYFCDEKSKEKTITQQNLMGIDKVKSRVVHSFAELAEHGAQGIIDDILFVYKSYCKGYLNANIEDNKDSVFRDNVVSETSLIQKSIIANTDKCKQYFSKMFCPESYKKEMINSSELDDWGYKLLLILFEHKSIQDFNFSMFLDVLKKSHQEDMFNVVYKRWEAIQLYYSGQLKESIDKMEESLKLAKGQSVSDWLIKDILIDLRNCRQELSDMENKIIIDEPAHNEIIGSKFSLFFPIMDRIKYNLFNNIVEENFKQELQSPHTVMLGYNITQTDMISDCYITSIFYGSLTHLSLLNYLIKMLSFKFVKQFDNWNFRMLLLKEVVYSGNSKEISNIDRLCPDLLVKLNEKEAKEIYDFCNNIPIKYIQLKRKLQAMGIVGYFLNDDDFTRYSSELIDEINKWLDADNPIFSVAEHIFNCLNKISHRINVNFIADFCIKLIKKDYSRWFSDVFKLISRTININNLKEETSKILIKSISDLLDNSNYTNIVTLKEMLIALRIRNKELTNLLDLKIKEKLPSFYEDTYKLETTKNEEEDVSFVKKYLEEIKSQNKIQGKNGAYYGFASSPYDTIRNILIFRNAKIEDSLVDDIVNACCDTLLSEKQGIKIKCCAIDLILYFLQQDEKIIIRNKVCLEKIKNSKEIVQTCPDILIDSNINETALLFNYYLLLTHIDKVEYVKLFEVIPYINDNTSTQIQICSTIEKYLENKQDLKIDTNLESIILQKTISWLRLESLDVRWHCVNIMFMLLRNESLKTIINFQLTKLIDNDNCYIKNLIQSLAKKYNIDEDIKHYINQKCSIDTHFVVRKVYNDLNKT